MNYFTIKDIENLSGVKAHTLRIWEKRYGIILSKRKESKHRFYDNDDLKNILRIIHLYHDGFKISAIAHMQEKELDAYETHNAFSEFGYLKVLIESTLDLDEQAFVKTLESAVYNMGLEACMVKIIYPYFEKIGMLWLNNEALPAQERFASNIILKKIITEIDKLDATTNSNDAIILFTPLQEYHEIPLLFMHYLLKKSGRHVYYLGTNVQFEFLKLFLEHNSVGTLYFHIITNLTHEKIDKYINDLTRLFQDKKIVMSGKLTDAVTVKSNNLKLLHSLNEMIAFGNNQTT